MREQRLVGGTTIVLLVSIVFIAVTSAHALPTAVSGNIYLVGGFRFSGAQETVKVAELAGGSLADIGREIVRPYTVSAGSSDYRQGYIEELPAVPAAVLMVLTGFFCVLMVRERKIWLWVLIGLLWSGYACVRILPQLALRLCYRGNGCQNLLLGCAKLYMYRSVVRAEGTRYMGLLRYLAGIPESRSFLRLCDRYQTFNGISETENRFGIPHFAIRDLLLSCLILPSNRLTAAVKRFVCFSPAFIFGALSRGPPEQEVYRLWV